MRAIGLLLDPRFWLAVVLAGACGAGAGYFKGGKDKDAEYVREAAIAAAVAREAEGELQRMNNKSSSSFIERMRKLEEKARALPKIYLVNDCTVPADVGGLLNNAQRLRGDAGSGSSPGDAGAAADSSCAAELDIAKRNYAEVCVPNAEQLSELQKRWRMTVPMVNQVRK